MSTHTIVESREDPGLGRMEIDALNSLGASIELALLCSLACRVSSGGKLQRCAHRRQLLYLTLTSSFMMAVLVLS